MIEPSARARFATDGVVYLPGLFSDWVVALREGVAQNLREPGPRFADNVAAGGAGRFWDDYCNWRRIPAFEDFVRRSPAAKAAAALMGSQRVQVFHEHVLVKEPGTAMATPWHQDSPYYFVDGEQTLSFWVPLDPVDTHSTLRFIAGSHRWHEAVLPRKWADNSDFYDRADAPYRSVPDPSAAEHRAALRHWTMRPGDAVAFDFRTAHGAQGNPGANRRRVFSLRLIGDDARYVERPGTTSPPFDGHGMRAGQALREDWFPIIWPPVLAQ